MDIEIDTAELRQFAADVAKIPAELDHKIPAVVSKGALNIKTDMVDAMRESTHFKGFADISYDLLSAGYAAEIGPNKGGPGAGANIAYFGTSKGGGTVEDPQEALDREVPIFEQELGKLIEGLL